jgi:WD40 repeat protein
LFTLLCPTAFAQKLDTGTGVLDVKAPAGATITINGTDYGTERHFEMRPLDEQWLYPYDLAIRFEGGKTVERNILLKGGWNVRLALSPAESSRPELVLQTTNPFGPLALSPDSRYLLTRGANGAILWDAKTGRQLRTFGGHHGSVSAVAISPDWRHVLTGSADKTAIMSDLATGERLRVFVGHSAWVLSLAFSPDGREILTGSWDNTAALWDAETGERLRVFQGHSGEVHSVALSSDGRLVLTGSQDKSAILWDAATGQRLRNFQGHTEGVHSVAFSPDSRQILTGSLDKSAILWDALTGVQLRVFQGHLGWVYSVAFSPDGRQILTGSWDKTAVLWDAETGQKLRTIPGHQIVGSVAFSGDGRQVLTDGGSREEGGVVLWDAQTGKPVRAFRGHTELLESVLFSPDGRWARVLSWGLTESRWDLNTGLQAASARIGTIIPPLWQRTSSPDGRQALGTPEKSDGKIAILWDVTKGRQSRAFVGHSEGIHDLAWSVDGRNILTGSSDETAILWDATTGQQLRSFHLARYKSVFSVAIGPDGLQVMTGYGDRAALWDVATGKLLHVLQGDGELVTLVGFSPDGRQVFASSHGKTVVLWDVATGRRLASLSGHTGIVGAVCFSPDGRHMLTSSDTDPATLWQVATGKKLRVLGSRCSSGKQIAFRPDGRQVLIGDDGTLRLWDMATGEELIRLISLDDGRDWLVVTPDGLFDGSAGGREKVMYRIGGGLNVVPVDRFFQDFYRPGLLAEVSRGASTLPDVRISRVQPPKLKIVTPESGDVQTAEAMLEVEASDQGGGVANLAVYQNGARVLAPSQSRAEGKTVHRSFKVALVEGRNHLRITASTADGSWEAEPAELVLTYERPLAKSRMFLMAVGVNKHADANLNLKYAAPDAQAFAELFRRRGAALYDQVKITTLLDDQATKPGIHDTLKRIAAETRPQDTLALFLAGHGTMVGQRYYFVPYELRRQASQLEDDIRRQAIPADELSDDLGSAKALKRMLILDTCASGGALAVAMKGRSGFALRGAIERLSRTQGIFTIAAASASEEAQEAKQLGHGVLSYALLAGLKAVDTGPLDGKFVRTSNPEGVVDVLEWFSFAAGQVPRLTEKLYGAAQDVQTSAQGASFPVLPLEAH